MVAAFLVGQFDQIQISAVSGDGAILIDSLQLAEGSGIQPQAVPVPGVWVMGGWW